jgi:hypothetical protein
MDGATRIEKPVITREWRRTFADVPVTFARAYDTMAILPDYHDSGTGILPAGQWLMFSDIAGETGHSLCDLDDPSFAERHCLPAGRVERVRPWCSATRLPKVDSGATSQGLSVGPFRLPPSAFRLPPSAFRLPPSAFRLPPSAFRLPPSAFRPPSSVFRPPSSVFRPPSSVLRPPSSVFRLPSSVFRLPSSVFRLPPSVLRPPSPASLTVSSVPRRGGWTRRWRRR